MDKIKSKVRNDKMDILFIKDKKPLVENKVPQRQQSTSALASGDCRCRLCGASAQLQHMKSDKLGDVIATIFDVQVPAEGMICGSCVKCLRVTERFRALVLASFDRTASDGSMDSSNRIKFLRSSDANDSSLPLSNPQKEIIELLKTRLKNDVLKKKRERRRYGNKYDSDTTALCRKTIISCCVCGQKYPMMVQPDSNRTFVCSRCKQNQSKSEDLKNNETLAGQLGDKTEFLKKTRLLTVPKKLQQDTVTRHAHLPKYKCGLCPKKYALAQNLAEHVNEQHDDNLACTACNVKCQNVESYEKHLLQHVDKIHQCDKCMRVFKSKRALQNHFQLMHEKQKSKTCSS